MKKSILIVKPLMPALRTALGELYDVHELYQAEDKTAYLQSIGGQIEVIASSAWSPISRDILRALPNLKMIANFGVGLDHIDLDFVREKKILLSYTPDVLNDAVADVALALILATARRITEAHSFVQAGKWPTSSFPLGKDLRQKTAGIVGLGRLGKAVAKRCEAFGMKIAYQGPRRKSEPYTYYESLRDLALASDFLILTLPGGKETYRVVNADILKCLGANGYLINVSRGSVVDESALIEALKTKIIAGAGLDVIENEPRPREDLLGICNLVLLPHIGSATEETRGAMKDLVLANLQAYFAGQPLLTPVDLQ
ncbi:MAG: 2-hydroxyacid dehydrogenase [Proteobacteria bacterium]|nr:MAG: 2-hydroxyacid dehydrogenase [Pseudomonadota bacterium]